MQLCLDHQSIFKFTRTKKSIMKSINWVQMFFGLILLGFVACTSNTASENETEEETTEEETQEEQAPAPVTSLSGENFTVTVLESGIPSPRKEMKGTIGGVEVTVNYGSPAVKDRTIWGDLVPYDKVWRTGANKCTSITFSADVVINGQKLAAGTYGLFTLPGESEWAIIFNENAEMWGSGDYSEDKDVLRVNAKSEALEETQESMELVLDGNNIVLKWAKLAVPFTVAPA